MKDLQTQIAESLPNGVIVESKKESPYLIEYNFASQNGNKANIKFYYNDKKQITKIWANDDEFSQTLKQLFNHITMLVDEPKYTFPLPQLEAQYENIKKIIANYDISIKTIESFPYRQRYTFIRNHSNIKECAVFDITFDKYGNSYVNNLNGVKTTSQEFSNELREILLDFLEVKEVR